MKRSYVSKIVVFLAILIMACTTKVNAADLSGKINATDTLGGAIQYSVNPASAPYDSEKNINNVVATLTLSEENIDEILAQVPGQYSSLAQYVISLTPDVESKDNKFLKNYNQYGSDRTEKNVDEAVVKLKSDLDSMAESGKSTTKTVWPTIFTVEYFDGSVWKLAHQTSDGVKSVGKSLEELLGTTELVYGKNFRINAYNTRAYLWGWKTTDSEGQPEYNYINLTTEIVFPISGVTSGGARQTFFTSLEQAVETVDIEEIIINEDLTIENDIVIPEGVKLTVANGKKVDVLPDVKFEVNDTVTGTVNYYYNVIIEDSENGKVTVATNKVAAGEKVAITVVPDEGYEIEELIVDGLQEGAKVENNEFIMPGNDVTIKAKFKAKEVVNVAAPEKDETPKTGAMPVVALMIVISIIGLAIVRKSK